MLLGYTLFVGISGRLNPAEYPHDKEERASWLLGLWIGLALSLSISIGLYASYSPAALDPIELLKSVAPLLTSLLAPALALYAYHRFSRSTLASVGSAANFNWAISDDELQTPVIDDVDAIARQADKVPATENQEVGVKTILNVSPAYLETAQIDRMNNAPTENAVNDAMDRDESASNSKPASVMQQLTSEPTPSLTDVKPYAAPQDHAENRALRRELTTERTLREETEQHLRITRKALSVLESNTRHQSNTEADIIIDLEEKLAKSIETAADNETEATEQKTRRLEIEQDVADIKRRMVKAKQEIRRSAAARAKALSTANQSIAFARQSVQIRTRLESELDEAQETINNRQKTVSSLIKALEKEKRKTQLEVSSMARQLVLQEKQLNARRSLEEVARSVENKLTSRLVKKVAKAKPLMSNLNQGEAN